MLHVLLEHPYSNSLSNRLLRRKTVSCKNIRWPEMKCVFVYDEKMPLSPAGNFIHSALKMYWEKGLQQGNPCHELGVRNFAARVCTFWPLYGHLYLMPLDPFSFCLFSWSLMFCAHTHTHTEEKSLQRSQLLHANQHISEHFSVLSHDIGNIFAAIAKRKVTVLKLHV